MRLELLLTSILAIFSSVGALSYKDRSIIAQLKLSTEQTEKLIFLELLRRHIEIAESTVDDRGASPLLKDILGAHISKAKRQLDSDNFTGRLLTHLVTEFEDIVRAHGQGDPGLAGRIISKSESITPAFEEAAQRHVRIFLLATGPKVRELSAEAQETEGELITAYNNVAHAGFVPMVDSFMKLPLIMKSY